MLAWKTWNGSFKRAWDTQATFQTEYCESPGTPSLYPRVERFSASGNVKAHVRIPKPPRTINSSAAPRRRLCVVKFPTGLSGFYGLEVYQRTSGTTTRTGP